MSYWATSTQGLNRPYGVVIVGNYIYIANSSGSTISKISLTNPTTDFNTNIQPSNIYNPYALAVNKSNNLIYYTTNGNQIRKTDNTAFVTLNNYIYDMKIDNTNTYLYAVCSANVICKISLSNPSGDINQSWATNASQGVNNAKSIVIDRTNTYIYMLNVGTNSVGRISLTNPTTNYNYLWATPSGMNNPIALAMDSTNTYMYVVNNGNNTIIQLSMATPTNNLIFATATAGLFNPAGIVIDASNIYMYVSNQTGGGNSLGTISQISLSPSCFLAGTKILTDEGYIQIQHLRKGDLIQTLCHGLVPIDVIGFKQISHLAKKERVKDQLYNYSTTIKTPELFEDLILTGCHSVLVDEFTSPEQREKTLQILGDIYVTDDKYRLPACLDEENAKVFETPGEYTIYHFALENADYYMNYGVFANGLLVESSSKRYMKECSQMTLMP